MIKAMLAVMITVICSGISFAESMTGKIGYGLRSDSFDVRYFVTERVGVHGGMAMIYAKPSGQRKSTEYAYGAGAFYSKEVTDGVLFQTGLTVQYSTGKDAGVGFYTWSYNPYVGAEYVYKGRFGLDFKVIPIQYFTQREKGANLKGWAGLNGSFGAHLYF